MRARHLALAAILLVSLSGCGVAGPAVFIDQKNAASDAQATSDLVNAKTAVIAYTTNDPTTFPTVDELGPWGYEQSEGVDLVVLTGDITAFCVEVTAASGTVLHATDSSAVLEGGC